MSINRQRKYTAQELSAIRESISLEHHKDYYIKHNIPPELRRKKRGSRGGIKVNIRKRKCRIPLPTINFGNVRSIRTEDKLDQLRGNIKFMPQYRNVCVIALSETWLDQADPDEGFGMENYSMYRCDRDKSVTSKSKGGGVCTYINNDWCSPLNTIIKESNCYVDVEMLSLQCRPFYLPREITCVAIINVYIPPDADSNVAATIIGDHVNNILTHKPDAAVIIMGDFNKCSLNQTLPKFSQLVTCNTQSGNKLDLFYCNIKHSYKCYKLSPIGSLTMICLV